MSLTAIHKPITTGVGPEGLADFTEDFWAARQDLMPEGGGVVVMMGLNEAGNYVDIMSASPEPHGAVISLGFDGRNAAKGVFVWQLTKAKLHGERLTFGVEILEGAVDGIAQHHDRQGKLTNRYLLGESSLVLAGDLIQDLAMLPATLAHDAELRRRKLELSNVKSGKAAKVHVGYTALFPTVRFA